MARVARISVDLEASSAKFTSGLNKADRALASSGQRWNTGVKRIESTFTSSMRRTGQAVAAIDGPLGGIASRFQSLGALAGTSGLALGALSLGLGALSFAMLKVIKVGQEMEQAQLKTSALLKATGSASGQTTETIRAMSREIALATLASTSGVEAAAQKLMTFRSVGTDVFRRTLEAAQDLSAVGFGGLESTVVQLGKALENPAEGISALTRVGVSFTAQQKDMIKTLQESGRVLDAQRMILEAVENQVGGAGGAEAQGLSGALDTLTQRWSEFLESVADRTGIITASTAAINDMADAIKVMTDNMGVDARIAAIDTAIAQMDSLQNRILSAPMDGMRWGFQIFGAEDNNTNNSIAKLKAKRDSLIRERDAQAALAEVEKQRAEMEGRRAQEQGVRDAKAAAAAEEAEKVAKDAAKEAEKRTATIQKQIEALQFQEAQLSRTNREQAIYAALQAAGLQGGEAEAAQVRDLAAALYDATQAREALVDASERQADAWIAMEDAGKNLRESVRTPAEKYQAEMDKLGEMFAGGFISQETFERAADRAYVDMLESQRKAAGESQKIWEDTLERIGSTIADTFKDVLTNVSSIEDAFKRLDDLALKIAADIAAGWVTDGLNGMFSSGGGGGGGGGGGWLGAAFDAGMAYFGVSGGGASAGSSSMDLSGFADGGLVKRFADGGLVTGYGSNENPAMTAAGADPWMQGGNGSKHAGWMSALNGLLSFGTGGAVSGPGTGRSDSILARLSDGEFVINADATKKHRRLLEALNTGNLPGYANGGYIGSSPSLGQQVSRAQISPPSSEATTIKVAPVIHLNGAMTDQQRQDIRRIGADAYTDARRQARRNGGM